MESTAQSMKELEEEAALFLHAARRYWDYCNKRGIYGAVIWCQDRSGFGAVFTRGEYRQQMLYNIDCLGEPVHFGRVREV